MEHRFVQQALEGVASSPLAMAQGARGASDAEGARQWLG